MFFVFLVDEKLLVSCGLRSELRRLGNTLLQESWQREMVLWTRVVAMEIVKNVDILRYFQSCIYKGSPLA